MVVTPISGAQSAETLFEELRDYGSPAYFTTVTKDSNDYISCSTDSGQALYFHVQAEQDMYTGTWKTFINYVSIYSNQHRDNYTLLTSIIRTQYGLIIMCSSTENGETREVPYIIITKDNADKTVIFGHPASQSTQYLIERDVFVCLGDTAPVYAERDCLDTDDTVLLTSVVPVVVEGLLNYCPYLKWVIQKQYNVVGELALGTQFYWTDGQIALLDT